MRKIFAAGGAAAVLAAAAGAFAFDRRRVQSDPLRDDVLVEPAGRPFDVACQCGTVIRAVEHGPTDGPTVILIHGWTCTRETWNQQVKALSDRYRVITYDNRGHGLSSHATAKDYSVDAYAADLEAVLCAVSREGEKPVLAGHSLGAIIAMTWAVNHAGSVSERISGVGLISSSARIAPSESSSLPLRLRYKVASPFVPIPAPLPPVSNPIINRIIQVLVLSLSASPASVALTERMILSSNRVARSRTGRSVLRLDLVNKLDALDVPVSVLVGLHDQLTPPEYAREMAAAVPQLRALIELKRVGHMSPMEAPADVNRLIEDLLTIADEPKIRATSGV